MKRFVIDGNNVMRAHERYRPLAKRDIEAARALLVHDVGVFAAGEGRALVVFDAAHDERAAHGPRHEGDVIVVYAGATEADTVIERTVHRWRRSGDQVIVVTSDAAMQWTVLGANVVRMSARDFIEELLSVLDGVREYRRVGARRVTLGERIDDQMRARLRRMAEGGGS